MSEMKNTVPLQPSIKAFAFDVFGTVVDWRGSIAREAAEMAAKHRITIEAEDFADAWRAGYAPAMQRVRSGELAWLNIDQLHRLILDSLLDRFGFKVLNETELAHLNRAWHRLTPWPDSIAGLTAMKRHFIITTLSNGNFALLTNMAKNARLPWDCIISAELFNHYKPDPEIYLGAARLLGIEAAELMLVAAHPDDLRAAKAQGLRTSFVRRLTEFGEGRYPYTVADCEFDAVAQDFVDLARQLKAVAMGR